MKINIVFLCMLLLIAAFTAGCSDGTAFDITKNSVLFDWDATTPLTTERFNHSLVAYNGFLYVIGGTFQHTPSYINGNDVQYARIHADGTASTWTATSSFSSARCGHTSVAHNGYIYVIGGANGGTLYNDVQYAKINADGTIGAWNATTSFTAPTRVFHTSVVYNNHLYVIGGANGTSRYNDVQYAKINADGTVGTWTATSTFTTGRCSHTSVAHNGYLYVIGGHDYNVTYFHNDVQYAIINTDGSIGTWAPTSSFITARQAHASITDNGYLYVIGGANGNTPYNDIQISHINADGTIDAWSVRSSFSNSRWSHACVVSSAYLYIVGGTNNDPPSGTFYNDVQFARIHK